MDNLRPPPPFSFEGNLSHAWKVWKKHFTTVSGYGELSRQIHSEPIPDHISTPRYAQEKRYI